MDFDTNLETITPNTLTTLTIGSTGGIVAPSGTTGQRPGAPVSGTLRYNTTTTLIEIYQNGIWINLGATAPAAPTTSVQWNNAGVFGGSANFIWNNTTNALDIITGTLAQNRMRIGGTTNASTATLYIETDGTNNEGQRVYFNNGGNAAVSGFITYAYDTFNPYIGVIDNDDDPTFITFNTVSTGTFAAPLYVSAFGSRGNHATRLLGAESGFAWYVGSGTSATALVTAADPVMELDTQWLRVPTGTTAQRPGTPEVGMTRYNTDLGSAEVYESNAWCQLTGVVARSTTSTVTAAAGPTNIVSYSVPGGLLGTNRLLRINLNGLWNNASGAGRTVTVTVSYGATTLWSDVSASIATGNTLPWNMQFVLSANNATNSQRLGGLVTLGSTLAAATGNGDLASDETTGFTPVRGTSAINSTAVQTLNVAITFSGGTNNWTTDYYTIEAL